MTETLTTAETQPTGLGATLASWLETPPPSLCAALAEGGTSVEALEEYTRSGISTEEAETLRKVLVQGAASGAAEDAALLARLTPLLDPRERAWDRVMRAKSTGEVLSATVTEAVKGGLVVDLGVRGFVPSSQVGLSVPRNLTQYLGQNLKLRVMEVDRRRHTVILSNRQVMEEERARKRKTLLGRLEDGEVRKGTVRRLTDIGAFVDIGGVDGLLHVSEISWKRVEHPSDVLKVGQKIQVKVLRVDPDAGRVSLSMRQLMSDPWEDARRKYAPGTSLKVKVGSLVQQGAVVELEEEGLEGFIPVSELASRRIAGPEEVVQPGQEVDAVVIDLRPREHRIVFSLRKLEQKRERQVVENYQRRPQRSDRTTLGDLFGHLFEEYQHEPDEPAATAAADANGAAAPAEAPAGDEVKAAAFGTDEAGTAAVAVAEEPAAETDVEVEDAPTAEAGTIEAVAETEPDAAEEITAVSDEPEAAEPAAVGADEPAADIEAIGDEPAAAADSIEAVGDDTTAPAAEGEETAAEEIAAAQAPEAEEAPGEDRADEQAA